MMGLQDVKQADPEELRQFMKLLLRDVRALEKMLDDGTLESGVRRIGAEQELFLVDRAYQPAPSALEVLAQLAPEYFTTELALFNIEFNLDPVFFGGNCLRKMEGQLNDLLEEARHAAASVDCHAVMMGILPTLMLGHLTLENMTPNPRYFALNDALCKLRGGSYSFNIKGSDEFIVEHDSVMLESCNTSFQVHFQVGPDEFARLYNAAQVATAPVMAAATNSPLLFGKRLWHETRIALFQQSIDTRSSGKTLRERMPRVSFGSGWVDDSVLEIFQEDISRFRVLINTAVEEDPFEALSQGRPPSLKALRLHNGTVYRWNRVCYGVSDGKPHIRIENRVLPSGPTVLDEMANAAFWFGVVSGLVEHCPNIRERMTFDDAKKNFVSAARQGLGSTFVWLDGAEYSATDLILHELLPMARQALTDRELDPADIDRYLGVVEERVSKRRPGSKWMLESFDRLRNDRTVSESLSAVTAATIARQELGLPVHHWTLAEVEEGASWEHNFRTVGQFMSTDLVTVNQDELIDMVASVMDWKRLRHVPVENGQDQLVGMVTYRILLRYFTGRDANDGGDSPPVSTIMDRDVISVPPHTLTLDAIELMRKHQLTCLPVVDDGRLVGIITEVDFLDISRELLRKTLATGQGSPLDPAQS